MTDIAYIPPIAYNAKNYTQISKSNLITGLMLYGQRKNIDRTVVSTSTVQIYTVPAGKTFFLINANVRFNQTTAVTSGQTTYRVYINAESQHLFRINSLLVTIEYERMTFPTLLRLDAGNTINIALGLGTSGVVDSSLRISGYEIDTALLPNFE